MRKSRKFTTVLSVGVCIVGLAIASTLVFAQGVLFVKGDQVLIGDDTAVAGAKLVVKSASTGPTDAIFLQNSTGPARLNLQNLAQTNTTTTDQKWTINSNGDLRFTAGADAAEMRLDAAGTLTVAQGIIVNGTPLNVPDYVFESDYDLMPLDELKSFIETNKHLPQIPSANDVAGEGLNMTQMQLRLLEKVEELTLYTLQQQETIEKLQAKIERFENQ